MPDRVEPSPAPTRAAFERDLAEDLARRGVIDAQGVDRVRRVAAESGARIDEVLTRLGVLTERDLAETAARLLGLTVAEPGDYPRERVMPERLKAKFLRRARAVPLGVDAEGRLRLALADPLDAFTRDAVAAAASMPVVVAAGIPFDVDAALERLYGEGARDETAAGDIDDLATGSADPFEDDAERLKDLASEAPVIRLVNRVIARAVETRASDIHLEPFEDRLRVRYRYDGVLHEAETHSARLQAAIVSRVKVMARLDIAERRLPQDGRIKMAVRGQDVDFRVSTMPSLHGEKVVMRILDRGAVDLDFDRLGLAGGLRERLETLLELPNGILLVTGPTGSGKTTTLYTSLLHLNQPTRNVVTVEDPIEYQLGGINQVQVKPQIGLTFAALLRAILRQDPDVIMVGEIRDLETAQIAVQAALTGHLVLSTLHTNSAAATVTRLRDMGLEDYLIGATLNGVLAQRLVRRLCERCKRPVEAPPEIVERFRLGPGPVILHEPHGCEACRNTGFRGRAAIGELLAPDEETRRLILRRGDQTAIQRAAAAAGMTTMYEAGLAEVRAGRTSLPEMLRSIREE